MTVHIIYELSIGYIGVKDPILDIFLKGARKSSRILKFEIFESPHLL
jgi:hypothetical protein